MPEIEVNPEEEIVREAEQIQKCLKERISKTINMIMYLRYLDSSYVRNILEVISPWTSMFLLISLNVILLRMLILLS